MQKVYMCLLRGKMQENNFFFSTWTIQRKTKIVDCVGQLMPNKSNCSRWDGRTSSWGRDKWCAHLFMTVCTCVCCTQLHKTWYAHIFEICYLELEMFTKDFVKINVVGSQINLNIFKRLLAWDNVTQGKITDT